RVNTSVSYQSVQSQSSDLTTNWIKSRKNNRFRCIINNNFDTCSRFQSADIASFPPDNPTFYFIAFYMENRDCILDCTFARLPLNRLDNNLLSFLASR